jgi:hypothetical protein
MQKADWRERREINSLSSPTHWRHLRSYQEAYQHDRGMCALARTYILFRQKRLEFHVRNSLSVFFIARAQGEKPVAARAVLELLDYEMIKWVCGP